MKLGAVILTTGLKQYQGVAALLRSSGSITTGQRLIAAFQCCGIARICIVAGPENKKEDRKLAQNGVIFLHCESNRTSILEAARLGLAQMQGKFDRVFVTAGDFPMFLPETLRTLLQSTADICIPVFKNTNGFPILLNELAMAQILDNPESDSLENAVMACTGSKDFVPVPDAGCVIRDEAPGSGCSLLEQQNRQLIHPVAEVSLSRGTPLFDGRLSMLLHLIDETKSVRLACNLTLISYSTAWGVLNQAEEDLGFPLITRSRGGASGSGSELTRKGRQIMDAYDAFSTVINQTAQTYCARFFQNLTE